MIQTLIYSFFLASGWFALWVIVFGIKDALRHKKLMGAGVARLGKGSQ